MNKICTECHLEKNIQDFWFNKTRNRYNSKCKSCKYQINKKYINISKEKKAEYDKKYREKHSDVLKIRKKEEYERNKEVYINRQKKYQKTLLGRLKHNLRTRICNSIKRKSNSTFDLLGCDIYFYISYLEYFFDNQMSWDNYGIYWQIDHVNPLKNFNLDDINEQKEAFKWSNTRPLSAYLNLSKKMNDEENINKHKQIVQEFLIATSSNCGDSFRV